MNVETPARIGGLLFAIPLAVVGLVLGLLSQKTSGRNINLVVLALAIIRLALGGGIL